MKLSSSRTIQEILKNQLNLSQAVEYSKAKVCAMAHDIFILKKVLHDFGDVMLKSSAENTHDMFYVIMCKAPHSVPLHSAHDIFWCFPSYNWDISMSYKMYLFYSCPLAVNYGIWKEAEERLCFQLIAHLCHLYVPVCISKVISQNRVLLRNCSRSW